MGGSSSKDQYAGTSQSGHGRYPVPAGYPRHRPPPWDPRAPQANNQRSVQPPALPQASHNRYLKQLNGEARGGMTQYEALAQAEQPRQDEGYARLHEQQHQQLHRGGPAGPGLVYHPPKIPRPNDPEPEIYDERLHNIPEQPGPQGNQSQQSYTQAYQGQQQQQLHTHPYQVQQHQNPHPYYAEQQPNARMFQTQQQLNQQAYQTPQQPNQPIYRTSQAADKGVPSTNIVYQPVSEVYQTSAGAQPALVEFYPNEHVNGNAVRLHPSQNVYTEGVQLYPGQREIMEQRELNPEVIQSARVTDEVRRAADEAFLGVGHVSQAAAPRNRDKRLVRFKARDQRSPDRMPDGKPVGQAVVRLDTNIQQQGPKPQGSPILKHRLTPADRGRHFRH